MQQIRGRATIPSERDDSSAQNELENSAEIGWFQNTAHDDHGGIPTGVVGVPDQQSVHCPVKKMHIESESFIPLIAKMRNRRDRLCCLCSLCRCSPEVWKGTEHQTECADAQSIHPVRFESVHVCAPITFKNVINKPHVFDCIANLRTTIPSTVRNRTSPHHSSKVVRSCAIHRVSLDCEAAQYLHSVSLVGPRRRVD